MLDKMKKINSYDKIEQIDDINNLMILDNNDNTKFINKDLFKPSGVGVEPVTCVYYNDDYYKQTDITIGNLSKYDQDSVMINIITEAIDDGNGNIYGPYHFRTPLFALDDDYYSYCDNIVEPIDLIENIFMVTEAYFNIYHTDLDLLSISASTHSTIVKHNASVFLSKSFSDFTLHDQYSNYYWANSDVAWNIQSDGELYVMTLKNPDGEVIAESIGESYYSYGWTVGFDGDGWNCYATDLQQYDENGGMNFEELAGYGSSLSLTIHDTFEETIGSIEVRPLYPRTEYNNLTVDIKNVYVEVINNLNKEADLNSLNPIIPD